MLPLAHVELAGRDALFITSSDPEDFDGVVARRHRPGGYRPEGQFCASPLRLGTRK
jgi:hypothetical protein